MTVKFEVDDRAFRRSLHEAVGNALDRMGDRVQVVFDTVYASHKGEVLGAVEKALRAEASREELAFTDEQIAQYAGAISEGRRITVIVERSL